MAQYATPARIELSLWPALLIAVSAISTLGFACVTPFAAFAVAAAYVLPARAALFSVSGVWLANQAIGFAFLNYPWDANTVLWGIAIGAAALTATAVASLVLTSSARPRAVIALGLALPAAFVCYEAGLFLVTFGLGGQEAFTPAIVGPFALLNLAWTVALVGAYEALRHAFATARPSLALRA
jgi:hypothetical protein